QGTGTSGALPSIACLTSPDKGCKCCRSTLDANDPLGRKNVRRNTSALLRIKAEQGEGEKTILIDASSLPFELRITQCGKTFYSGAVEWWPKKQLRQIDALILTHAHADAILGLDDLRGWTLRGAIQRSIPIYLTQHTFDEVSKRVHLLKRINLRLQTGGGDVPALTWHIFDPDAPFQVAGIEVVPLPVHHGKYFTEPPTPFYCLGFLFDRQLAYLSDVSYIPPEIYSRDEGDKDKPRLKALIVDCLRVEPFASHFGVGQAVETAKRLGAERNYLVGFGHRTSHQLWLAATRAL
ncbi:hypothetical protein RHOSPDRAFT_5670, partial [Rhodotorula sp. JG-1b]